MTPVFKLLFLGTGTSAGVPMIGCDCPVCVSSDLRNRRLRSSIYLSAGDMRILIDTSPDFRQQALMYNIRRVDQILITHAHVDHLFGLDEVRRLNTIQGDVTIPLYASTGCLADIRRIFDYIFRPITPGTYRPKLELRSSDEPFLLQQSSVCESAVSVTPFDVLHGQSQTQGFRFDFAGRSLAYMPDCHILPKNSRDVIAGVDVLILDTLRYRPHVTHLTLDESLSIIMEAAPGRAYLTHLCHDLDHGKLCDELIARGIRNVMPAYDGLRIEI